MANVFKEGKMLSNVADSYLTNGIADVVLPDGALVKLGELAADTTYEADGVEYDTFKLSAPTDAADKVAIVDYAGVENISETGYNPNNNYRMGIKLYGLKVAAGEITRVRYPALHDDFWLGADNFDTTPVVGKYAIAEAGKLTHKVADDLPTSGYAIKVLAAKDLTAGMASKGKMYLCQVVQL